MDDYGVYIWTAYGLSAAVAGWMLLDSWLRARRWARDVRRLEAEQDGPA